MGFRELVSRKFRSLAPGVHSDKDAQRQQLREGSSQGEGHLPLPEGAGREFLAGAGAGQVVGQKAGAGQQDADALFKELNAARAGLLEMSRRKNFVSFQGVGL